MLPSDLVLADGYVWVANARNDTVTKIDIETGDTVDVFDAGDTPMALTFDGDHVWAANWREGTISKISQDTGEVARFSAGPLPYDIVRDALGPLVYGLEFDGTDVWTANSADGTVSRMNLEGEVVATYPVGAGSGRLAFDGTSIWVTNTSDDTVTKLTLPEN